MSTAEMHGDLPSRDSPHSSRSRRRRQEYRLGEGRLVIASWCFMRGFSGRRDDDLFLFLNYGISSSRRCNFQREGRHPSGSEGSNVEVFTKLRPVPEPVWRAWMSAVLRSGAHPGSRQGRERAFESVEVALQWFVLELYFRTDWRAFWC
ncbi:unnamed protein product [Microthlaspi erraticum]|uniref:Uncharacterized protein n=1 Tax=Microthlaspi erraticum TaxID=1685480 RepID=A0A6D2JHD4_9BRAS|nr:unnamed protein product [Microthlaspi erraticum]